MSPFEVTIVVFLFMILIIVLYTINFYTINTKDRNSIEYVKNFDSYVAVLTYHMDKSYDIIHKDKVLIYSLEGIKPSDEDMDKAQKEYAKLVLRLIGPSLRHNLLNIYGDEETLIFSIVEYFNDRFENDEIRDTTINNMMNQGDEGDLSEELKQVLGQRTR